MPHPKMSRTLPPRSSSSVWFAIARCPPNPDMCMIRFHQGPSRMALYMDRRSGWKGNGGGVIMVRCALGPVRQGQDHSEFSVGGRMEFLEVTHQKIFAAGKHKFCRVSQARVCGTHAQPAQSLRTLTRSGTITCYVLSCILSTSSLHLFNL